MYEYVVYVRTLFISNIYNVTHEKEQILQQSIKSFFTFFLIFYWLVNSISGLSTFTVQTYARMILWAKIKSKFIKITQYYFVFCLLHTRPVLFENNCIYNCIKIYSMLIYYKYETSSKLLCLHWYLFIFEKCSRETFHVITKLKFSLKEIGVSNKITVNPINCC